MENASKALLIAGAVLIAIVLISLGVVLINNSGNASATAKNTANVMTQKADNGVLTINSINVPSAT